jgi:phosphatidylglycerophosphate synthase
VPYFIFMRALYPGREGMLVLVVLYVTLVAFLMSVTSRLIEESGHGTSPRGFLGKYAAFVVYFAAPLFAIPVLSPLGFVSYLLSGERVWMILLGYGIPLGLTLTGIVLCERYLGRAR